VNEVIGHCKDLADLPGLDSFKVHCKTAESVGFEFFEMVVLRAIHHGLKIGTEGGNQIFDLIQDIIQFRLDP
jgi:hypothetical protein